MTPGDLSSPPEGQLIRSARERAIPKLSIPAAAARIGISPEHWGNIERGYKSAGAGREPTRVDASPELLAKMAAVAGVMPAHLAGAGREDAARVLEEILRRDSRPAPPERPPVRDFARDDDEEGLQPFVEAVLRELYAVVGLKFGPGQRVPDLRELPELEARLAAMPGERVFREEPWFAELWDSPEMTPEERYRTVARIRKFAADDTGSSRVRHIGLKRTCRAAFVTTRLRSVQPDGFSVVNQHHSHHTQ